MAVSAGQATLDYAGLWRRATRLSELLRERGAGRDSLVAVRLPRGLDLAIALLGVLGAGAAYVPQDPTHPRRRLTAQLDELGVRMVVTDADLAGAAAEGGRQALVLGDPELARAPASFQPPLAGLDDLAYVTFTSGSTGAPKPVAVTHRGLRNHALALAELQGLAAGDRVLQFANVAFDVLAEELYPTWLAGATVVVPPAGALTVAALEQVLESAGITVVNLPGSYFEHWARDLVAGDRRPPAGLRLVVTGSEPVSAEAARLWLGRCGVPLLNAYGVTEATITSTVFRVPADPPAGPLLAIGSPIPGAEVVLLDGGLAPVASGEVGELCIGGEGLARGYHGRPDLTAERFVPDPRSERPGARLYRTGDLARLTPENWLEFLGRRDDQLQVRGHRVEPAEIEAALREHRLVEDVHVTRHPAATGGGPVAYVVPRRERPVPGPAELRAWLRERLPEYLVPEAVVLLDGLPRTPAGKVDRRALAATAPAAPGSPDAAPTTEMERAVVEAWRAVLGGERIGIHDDFFQRSGNSLLAIRILDRLRAAVGIELTMRDLLDAPTPAGLARRLAAADAGRAAGGLPALEPGRRRRLAPASLQQEQMWVASRLSGDGLPYHVQSSLRITGPLDAAALERSLTELARRHDILRTTFQDVDSQLVQVVHPPAPVQLARADLRDLPAAARVARLEELVASEARRPFDLGEQPPMRWTLYQLDEAEFELLLVEHHLLSDAASFAVLRRELAALYRAATSPSASPLPEPRLQYADYARWQRAALPSAAMRSQLERWTRALEAAPPALDLPTDHPRPQRRSFRGEVVRSALPAALRQDLGRFCRDRAATPFGVLLAAFGGTLSRWTGQLDLCAGSVLANRRQPGTEDLPGLFINTVALRWRLTDRTTFADLVRQTRELLLDAWASQEIPFSRVVEALNPARDPSRQPLTQVVFSIDDAPDRRMDLGDCTATVSERDNGTSKADLSVIVEAPGGPDDGSADGDERIVLGWEYDLSLFERSTVERLAASLARLLAAGLADPERPLAALPLLAPAERRLVVSEWNATSTPAPAGGRVHELVAAQAGLSPGAPAVAGPQGSLSRGELDRRSRAVAGGLHALGAGAGARVGLLLRRSPELATAILGVLRAGAAFVPLDPDHPPERLAHLAGDAGLAAVIADRRVPVAVSGLPRVAYLQDLEAGGLAGPDAPVPAGALAYVIYTSGSTGAPKGVAVEHRGLDNLVHWYVRRFGLGPGDRTNLVSAPSFDATVLELLPALAAGASVHLPPDEARLAPERLQAWLLDQRITVAHLATPLAEPLLRLAWPASTPLRVLLTGGDRLRVRPGVALPFAVVNNYGPTENTVMATSGLLPAGSGPDERRPPSIGRPLDNVQTYVLDRHLEPVPVGAAGELYLGGASLARGYVGRPDLTAERFLPSPFQAAGGRLYRTGDLARWLPDGSLDFVGRTDQQVKIRGVRVEPAEVAAAILAHPGVAAAEVVAVGTPSGETRLVACVVPAPGPAPTARELRAHCLGVLPGSMTPAAIHLMETFPLLPSGKVDRAALARTVPAGDLATAGEPELEGELEARIAAIWREVLGLERVGRHDDFFGLGGHSLTSVRIAARLERELERSVPPTIVFEHPTVAELAAVVGGRPSS